MSEIGISISLNNGHRSAGCKYLLSIRDLPGRFFWECVIALGTCPGGYCSSKAASDSGSMMLVAKVYSTVPGSSSNLNMSRGKITWKERKGKSINE